MNENSRLYPSKMIVQSNAAIAKLEADNELLREARSAMDAFVGDGTNYSRGINNLKRKMEDYQRVCDAFIQANEADIDDHQRLINLVGDQNLIGYQILDQIENNREQRDEYQRKVEHYRQVQNDTTGWQNVGEALRWISPWHSSAGQSIRRYEGLRDVTDEIIAAYEQKRERYHEIEQATSQLLFTTGRELRAKAKIGLGHIREASAGMPNSFHSHALTTWRRDIRDAKDRADQGRMEYFLDIYRQLLETDDPVERQALLDILLQKMTDEDIMRMIYNVDGDHTYGGRQSNLGDRFLENAHFADFMRGLFPDKCDDEIRRFLSNPQNDDNPYKKYGRGFSQVGCGYIALANTVMFEFANRPDEFYEIFGFPLYRVDDEGNLFFNFEHFAVYLYNDIGRIGRGTFPYRARSFFEDREIDVTITNRRFSIDRIGEKIETGQIIIYQNPTILHRPSGGDPVKVGAHAVVVTGIAENGDLIVSSWGRQYYIRLSDYEARGLTIHFEVITFGGNR